MMYYNKFKIGIKIIAISLIFTLFHNSYALALAPSIGKRVLFKKDFLKQVILITPQTDKGFIQLIHQNEKKRIAISDEMTSPAAAKSHSSRIKKEVLLLIKTIAKKITSPFSYLLHKIGGKRFLPVLFFIVLMASPMMAPKLHATVFNFPSSSSSELSFTPEQWSETSPHAETFNHISLRIHEELGKINPQYNLTIDELRDEIATQNEIGNRNLIIKGKQYHIQLPVAGTDTMVSTLNEAESKVINTESTVLSETTNTITAFLDTTKGNYHYYFEEAKSKLEAAEKILLLGNIEEAHTLSEAAHLDTITGFNKEIEILSAYPSLTDTLLHLNDTLNQNNFEEAFHTLTLLLKEKETIDLKNKQNAAEPKKASGIDVLKEKIKIFTDQLTDRLSIVSANINSFLPFLLGIVSTLLTMIVSLTVVFKKTKKKRTKKETAPPLPQLLKIDIPKEISKKETTFQVVANNYATNQTINVTIDNAPLECLKEEKKNDHHVWTFKVTPAKKTAIMINASLSGNTSKTISKAVSVNEQNDKPINLPKPKRSTAKKNNLIKLKRGTFVSLELLSYGAIALLLGTPAALPAACFFVLAPHLSLVFGMFLNELGHIIMARLLGYKSATTTNNLRGNIPLSQWGLSLIPVVGFLFAKEAPRVIIDELHTETKPTADTTRIRIGGFFVGAGISLITMLLVSTLFSFSLSVVVPIAAGFLIATLLAVASDFNSALPEGVFFCGNVGILSHKDVFQKDILSPLVKGWDITKVRGEQAGGIVHINDKRGKRKRIVNPKRGNLTRAMSRAFAFIFGVSTKKDSHNIVLSHLRFGTSSAPSVDATHPHAFMKERRVNLWKKQADGSYIKESKNLTNFVTHNGDFNGFNFSHYFKAGHQKSLGEINAWLKHILENCDAPGDSVNIAGMMDLLHTKGMWDASVRLVFYKEIATDFEDTLSKEDLKTLTDLFNSIFEFYSDIDNLDDMLAALKKSFSDAKDLSRIIPKEKHDAFIQTTVDVFLNNDIYKAVRIFSEGAIGSFGMITASTIDTGRAVLFSSNQPLALGISKDGKIASWVSEPAALKIKDDAGNKLYPYHLYLDDVKGEVVDLSMNDEKEKIEIKVYRPTEKKEYTSADELYAAGKIINTEENPLINSLPEEAKDPLQKSITEIPSLLKTLNESMQDGFNKETAEAFSEIILQKLKQPKNNTYADVVIVGEETSGIHGQGFSNMLGNLFPQLSVESVSGNDIISSDTTFNSNDRSLSVSRSKGSPIAIGKDTLVLAISQSGQTFSTYQATNYLTRICKEVFVMTGEMDSLMGRAIGQKYYKGAPFSKRIFTNLTGYRNAEASTIESISTGHLLTEILIHVLEKASLKLSKEERKEFQLHQESINRLKELRDETINQNIPHILDEKGSIHKELFHKAKKWAEDILEGSTVLFVAKLAILSLVSFGIAPLIPMAAVLGVAGMMQGVKRNFLSMTILFIGAAVLVGFSFSPIALISQFGIALTYTFISEALTIALRIIQKRRTGDRLYGPRSVVISEIPYIQKILEAYVTKLFGNSYGLASLVVKSGKTNNIPHFFAHQVVRGGKGFFGVAKHLAFQNKHINAVNMNVSQVLGIQNRGKGAEVLTIGHETQGEKSNYHAHISLNSNPFVFILDPNKKFETLAKAYNFSEEDKTSLLDTVPQLPMLFDSYGSAYFVAKHIVDELNPAPEINEKLIEDITAFINEEIQLEKFYENRLNVSERYIASITFFDALAKRISSLPWYLAPLKPLIAFKRWTTHNRTKVATTASPQGADDIAMKIKLLGDPLRETIDTRPSMNGDTIPFLVTTNPKEFVVANIADIEKMPTNESTQNQSETSPAPKKAHTLEEMKYKLDTIWENNPIYEEVLRDYQANLPKNLNAFESYFNLNGMEYNLPPEKLMDLFVPLLKDYTEKEKDQIVEYLFLRQTISNKNYLNLLKKTPYYHTIRKKLVLLEETEDKFLNYLLAEGNLYDIIQLLPFLETSKETLDTITYTLIEKQHMPKAMEEFKGLPKGLIILKLINHFKIKEQTATNLVAQLNLQQFKRNLTVPQEYRTIEAAA